MNLQNIFDSTDFVHASGTKEELAVAEFLKGQCESLGVPAWIEPFIVAVAGGVICHYIIKWLDGDK